MIDFVPILVFGIPFVAVFGRTIVQPVLRHLEKREELGGRAAQLEARLALMEQSLDSMERSVGRLVEEREFYRQLAGPRTGTGG